VAGTDPGIDVRPNRAPAAGRARGRRAVAGHRDGPYRRHAGDSGRAPQRQVRGRPGLRPRRTAATAERSANGRDPHLDNVKLAAILLVVVGHALEAMLDARGPRTAYFLIYTFHMPVFVLIAGQLSRRFRADARQCRRLVSHLLVPYVIFQTLYSVTGDLVAGNPVRVSYVVPDYLVWFLLSLVLWRLLGLVIMQLRFPLPAALGISLAVGMSDQIGRPLSLSRTLALLPFFVAGLLLRREHFAVLHRPAVRVASGVLLFGTGTAYFWAAPRLRTSYLHWRDSYHHLDLSWTQGLGLRAVALLIAAATAAAFLSLVPRRVLPVTRLGEGTMYAYLLHGLLVRPLKQAHLIDGVDTGVEQAGIVVLAAVLGLVLLTRPVRRSMRWLVEPSVTSLLAPQRAATADRAAPAPPGTPPGPSGGRRSRQPRPPAQRSGRSADADAVFDRLLSGPAEDIALDDEPEGQEAGGFDGLLAGPRSRPDGVAEGAEPVQPAGGARR
jgi:fucose 4-O-acetylase-like acetyltransferase